MSDVCSICEGSGMHIVERNGARFAQACECRIARRSERVIAQAGIPERHRDSTLNNFVPNYAGRNPSLEEALFLAQKFVKEYPVDGKGLLIVGGFGVGKTHLAVGILRELIAQKGAIGLFCDYRALLKKIQDSYGRIDVSERQILAPVFGADVLVLDELGAAKPTDWVWDTIQHILNTRYNDGRTTIITTNYRNERERPMGAWDELPNDKRDAVKAMYRDNLGDRITERMRSRLLEMCVVINMEGEDFRASEQGKATFKRVKYTAAELRAFGEAKEEKLKAEARQAKLDAKRAAESQVSPSAEGLGSFQISNLKLKKAPVPPPISRLLPDHHWTQADIDKEVARLTDEQNRKLGLS